MPSQQKRLALLAAITPPPDVVRDWRARFEKRAQKILNSYLLPSEQLSIQTAVDMIEWELFGKPDTNLPDTQFMMQSITTGALQVRSRFLEHIAFGGSPYYKDFEDIIRNEFSDLLSEQREFMFGKDGQPSPNETQIVEATKTLLKNSAQYRLLQSLTIATPILEEQPLSVAERQLLENSLHDSLFGPLTSPERYGAAGFAANREFTRKKYLLEQQTKPRGGLQGDNTRAKVVAWMLEQAQQWWPRELRDSPITKVSLGSLGNMEGIFVGDATGKRYSVEHKVRDWSREIQKDPIEKLYVPRVAERLCYEFVREFCRDQTASPSQILEKVVNGLAHDWGWTGTSPKDRDLFYFRELLFALRQPIGPIYTEIPANAGAGTIPVHFSLDPNQDNAGSTTTKISVESEKGEEELKHITHARVARRDYRDGLPRLLLHQQRGHDYPPLSNSVWYRLILDIEDGAANWKEPYIPGYVAVANSGKRWAFQRTKDDPHGGAEQVLISTNGIQNLIDAYQSIGLEPLANALAKQEKRHGQVSAADLENLVRRFSDYTYDNTYGVSTAGTPELKDFATCHKKGRLQIQCSGAATFL
ncbi:MAG: hypothetical protein HOQ05_10140, partial [Corynebacteriales bacterium]|nr:hypothetical protein [Mycobacteriales bacterium]